MKRHKSLYPLSWDHHHALVEARHLRMAEDIREAAERFIEFWQRSLQNHFREEEEILLPLFARFTRSDRAEIVETLSQHTAIRRRIDELTDRLRSGAVIDQASLKEMAASLDQHIRFEENELFPAIESTVPEEELWRMNSQLTER
ncbi:MAG TPA: hemerythrin domain-containing protein [Blastocatellia bacterium]|jgi:hemerythrin-like domain-containing protein